MAAGGADWRRAVAIVRAVLQAPDRVSPPDLDWLTRLFCAYVCAFLRSCHSRSRFGFQEPFGLVVQDVADRVVGRILSAGPPSAGDAHSRIRIARALARLPVSSLQDDEDLRLMLQMLLRRDAHAGLIRSWKEVHPEEARWLRSFKKAAQGHTGITIRKDPRGQILLGEASELGLPPMSGVDIEPALHGPPAPASKVLERLAVLLTPGSNHGGYCYLLDLVRCAHRHRFEILGSRSEGTGAAPTPERPRHTSGGIPIDLWAAKGRASIEGCARAEIAGDVGKIDARRRKGKGWSGRPADHAAGPEVREAHVRITVEMVARPYGMGSPELEHLSQRELILLLVPGPHRNGNEALHRDRTNYLIRRVRRRWLQGVRNLGGRDH